MILSLPLPSTIHSFIHSFFSLLLLLHLPLIYYHSSSYILIHHCVLPFVYILFVLSKPMINNRINYIFIYYIFFTLRTLCNIYVYIYMYVCICVYIYMYILLYFQLLLYTNYMLVYISYKYIFVI